jgi:hypothetical protein
MITRERLCLWNSRQDCGFCLLNVWQGQHARAPDMFFPAERQLTRLRRLFLMQT